MPDPQTRLRPRDATFVYEESDRHPSHFLAVYAFAAPADGARGGGFSRPEAVDWMRRRLGMSPIFRRRLRRIPLDLDLPRWVADPSFDVNRHVVVTEIDQPGWTPVRAAIAAVARTRLDLSRPPWEVHFLVGASDIPGLPEVVTVVVLKLHHSAGDGVATRELEARLFASDEPPAVDLAPARAGVAAAVDEVTRAVDAVVRFPLRMLDFGRGLARTGRAARRVQTLVSSGVLHEPAEVRPATVFNGPVTGERTFDVALLSLDEVQRARRRHPGSTVNDVMLATVSGALTAYLTGRGLQPGTSLAAMVPMSVRPIADWDSANKLALMTVDLHTDVRDAADRLRAISESARREKSRHAHEDVRRAAERVESSPAWLLRLAGWAKSHRAADGETVLLHHTTISNLPPAADRLSLRGGPLVVALGVLPIFDGDGLRHLISTQGSHLAITFSVDLAAMPDPERYRDLLRVALRELAGSEAG
ncbi:wax ester/triacylglycerol synthase family O-acyltransferase [Speluncibacter jeojiensis]|uniref:Diacylglycerol O-acyltransferase n=1 Tax=Speluncibacter jeojiensis TaxID=2710754 RepID=A0A9X4RIP4_9ACTN|nr:wax ester/triacylglycerol synthase family O-acyltransferase [Corynebacteriales bacterium D3-21]